MQQFLVAHVVTKQLPLALVLLLKDLLLFMKEDALIISITDTMRNTNITSTLMLISTIMLISIILLIRLLPKKMERHQVTVAKIYLNSVAVGFSAATDYSI